MGKKVKDGFENGSIIVCIDVSDKAFLIEGKEYEVISYWHMDRRYKNADDRFPAVIICDENSNRKVVPCRHFMSKSEYLIKTRNSKIDAVFGYE